MGSQKPAWFTPHASLKSMLEQASVVEQQDVFPVLSGEGELLGLVSSATLRVATAGREDAPWALAADLMQAPVSVRLTDDLRTAGELMLSRRLRALPVVGSDGRVLGLLAEGELTGLYLRGAARAELDASSTRRH
jgi:CBS domain-containing protein